MTGDEATKLHRTLIAAWPNSKIADEAIWADALLRVDIEHARLAYKQLRDTAEHAPSIARFLATIRGLTATKPARLREPCQLCDGTGWFSYTTIRDGYARTVVDTVTDPDTLEQTTRTRDVPIEYDATRPCRCSNGRTVDEAHRRCVEGNDAELDKYRRGPLVPAAASQGGLDF